MMRCAFLLSVFLSSCSGLSLERQPADPADEMDLERQIAADKVQLEQKSKDTVKVADDAATKEMLGLGGDGIEFGKEAAEAEAYANEAEKLAKEAEKKAGGGPNEREIGALDGRAMAEVNKESQHEGKVEILADTMIKEGEAAEREIQEMERKARHKDREEERQLAEIDRKIKKMKKGDFSEDYGNWKDAARKAEKIARAHQKEEERQEAHEKWLANRELREAAKAIETEREAKRAYRRGQKSQEEEVTSRIWQEADDLREEAETNGTLLKEDDVLRMLDVTHDTLADMKDTISRLAHDAEVFGRDGLNAALEQHIEGIRFKSVGAAAKMQEGIRHRAQDFVKTANISGQYDDKQFMARLAWLLNDIRDQIKELHEQTSGVGMRIQHWDLKNPEKMTVTLSLALDGVTDNVEFRNKLMRIDTARLAYANSSEACDQLAYMVAANLQPAYTSLLHMKDALDRMSKVVPSALADQEPRASRMMVNGTHALLNMAYAQHIAFKESTAIITQTLVPTVMQRFHCASNGFSNHLGLHFAFVALAAWIFSAI